MRKLLWCVLAVLLIGCASETEPERPAASAERDDESPSTSETPTTTAAPQWVEVARLNGNAEKQGDTFKLSGRARVRYESQAGFFALYVMNEGESLTTDGGIPAVTCTEPCNDETMMRETGEHYLEVKAAGGDWAVIVEEQRPG